MTCRRSLILSRMQIPKKDYNAEFHDKWLAVDVPSEVAYDLCTPVAYDGRGNWLALSSAHIFPKDTKHRGDVLVCTEGETYGLVELYETKAAPGGYIWKFRDPRRVVEFPVDYKGKALRPFEYICPKGEITPYPRVVKLGEKGFKKILKK